MNADRAKKTARYVALTRKPKLRKPEADELISLQDEMGITDEQTKLHQLVLATAAVLAKKSAEIPDLLTAAEVLHNAVDTIIREKFNVLRKLRAQQEQAVADADYASAKLSEAEHALQQLR